MKSSIFNEHGTRTVIRYNWEILKKHTNNDIHLIMEFFDNVYIRKSDNYFYLTPHAAKIVAESKDNSPQFILNAKEFIEAASSVTDSEAFVYLDLASKRSYFSYINSRNKKSYIPQWAVDEYDVKALKMNRLLTFDENNIYLLYETLGE